jgi:hypothetical protein
MSRSAVQRLAVGLLFSLHALTLSAASLWFGDKGGLHRIDTVTNQIALTVPYEPTVAIGVNAADGSVWALSQQRLAHLSEQGSVEFQVAVRDLGNGLGAPRLLVLNPNDGSVWARFENALLHLDAGGVVRHTLSINARDVAIAQDGSLWTLGQSSLQQHDASGARLRSLSLAGSQRFKHLALDDAGGVLWLAGEKELVQLKLSAPEETLLSVLAPETIAGISLDLQTGDLWAIGQNGLFAYGRDGKPHVSRDLRDFSIANAQALLFDFSSQAAWVGHQGGITRVTAAGTVAAAFPATVHVLTIAIGRTPVNITPVVSITAPADGALLKTATPRLSVDYDALCGTTPCGFPNSFFSTYTLFAQLNGTETGTSFVFDPAAGGASFTPSTSLPEGPNTFSAHARDSFGRFSATVSSTFTVDTVAPSVPNLTPASGAVVTQASILIAGSVGEAGATVTLGDQTQGPDFSFPVTLVPGANSFTLVVRDAAGNTTSLPLTYTYEPPNVLPSVAISSPADGASFVAPASFTVTANATDSDGTIVSVEFFMNGVSAGIDNEAPYTASLSSLALGTYTLTAQATDNRGGVTPSAAVTVTVGPPNVLPVVQLTASAVGTPPVFPPATVQMTATASDPDGTIAKVELLRNGTVEATLTAEPYATTLTNVPAGTYTLTARATDNRGGVTTSAPVTVVITAPSVTITSPVANSTIGSNNVLVRGRIVAPPYSGVRVNEQTAAVDAAGNFAVLVPLEQSPTVLTATLTLVDRRTATHTISINATGALLPFSVDVTPTTGFAPLATTYRITNPNNVAVTYSLDGSAQTFLGAGATAVVNRTYAAGVYTPTVVFRSGTSAFTFRVVIDSRDRAQTDQTIREVWSRLNTALAAGRKEEAVGYLSAAAEAKYGPLFDALLSYMPGIVASYSPLEQVSLTPKAGEYAMSRMDGETKRLYLIYFVRDSDGVWRVDGM